MQTIFAQISRPGKAAISSFRLSGALSLTILQKLLLSELNLSPRHVYYKEIYDPHTKELIDNAMVVYFQAPASFTGEDVVEIYTHGSVAILRLLTAAILKIPGVRMAEGGEFTKRAFLNHKLDLTSAEAIADLIDAETSLQHKQALNQLGGGLADLYNKWRDYLLNIISLLEAYIDFPEEEIPESVLSQTADTINFLKTEINNYLADNRRGEIMRSGLRLSILGTTNVGKSSLINFLCQRDIAIVSDIAGTTRDIIETHLDIGGYPVILQDTAGIRDNTKDKIEQVGIERAVVSAKEANIKIIIIDAVVPILPKNLLELIDENTLIIINKIDLVPTDSLAGLAEDFRHLTPKILYTSLKTNSGLSELLLNIQAIADNITQAQAEAPPITRERHRIALQQAVGYLNDCDINNDLVLLAEDIRMTIRTLSNITGIISVDEILGEIFSNFCIGK